MPAPVDTNRHLDVAQNTVVSVCQRLCVHTHTHCIRYTAGKNERNQKPTTSRIKLLELYTGRIDPSTLDTLILGVQRVQHTNSPSFFVIPRPVEVVKSIKTIASRIWLLKTHLQQCRMQKIGDNIPDPESRGRKCAGRERERGDEAKGKGEVGEEGK